MQVWKCGLETPSPKTIRIASVVFLNLSAHYSTSDDCIFYGHTTMRPVLMEAAHDIHLGPLVARYPQQAAHLQAAHIPPQINMWDRPLAVIPKGLRGEGGGGEGGGAGLREEITLDRPSTTTSSFVPITAQARTLQTT